MMMKPGFEKFDHILIVDDGFTALSPVNDLRMFSEVLTSFFTPKHRVEFIVGRPCISLDSLSRFKKLDESQELAVIEDHHHMLLINGRLKDYSALDQLPTLSEGEQLRDKNGSCVACMAKGDVLKSESFFNRLSEQQSLEFTSSTMLYQKPWDVIKYLDTMIEVDEKQISGRGMPNHQEKIPEHVTVLGDPLLIHLGANCEFGPMVVLDTRNGLIVIDEGVKVDAMAVINGPCRLGLDTQVAAHARLRGKVFTGPSCKVAGEISCSIIQGYSNKGHDGYLGHSYLGEWVNLGAMTTTSNLKNTYGPIKMQIEKDKAPQETGLQFLGSILGDHVKTAIGTRLMTGTCVGTGSMIACSGFPPKYLPPFRFLTDESNAAYQMDSFLEVAEKVMLRRKVTMTQAYTKALLDIHQQQLR